VKLALHRSLTFWSGILVMIFTAWTWRDSMTYQTWSGNRFFYAGNGSSVITFQRYTDPPFPIGVPASGFLGIQREPIAPIKGLEYLLLPPPLFRRGGGDNINALVARGESLPPAKTIYDLQRNLMKLRPRADWCLMIPHWLLLAGVGVIWAGMLVCRAKRRR
jgi:hypothetical protein